MPPTQGQWCICAIDAGPYAWGRFDVELSGRQPLLRVVASMMNLRSRLSGIATGDQAMFVRREAFMSVQGFPEVALMEDIMLSNRLRARSAPVCLRQKALTSSRRWQEYGIVRTIAMMWVLRAAFALGVSPDRLARIYGYGLR